MDSAVPMARERSVSDVCEVLALGWSFRGELYIKHCLCISREICTVPSLYRPSTDGLILHWAFGYVILCVALDM